MKQKKEAFQRITFKGRILLFVRAEHVEIVLHIRLRRGIPTKDRFGRKTKLPSWNAALMKCIGIYKELSHL